MIYPPHKQKIAACALFALVGLCHSIPALATDVGAAAFDFVLPGTQGTVKLSQHQGKAVYLDFWASWCGPCRESFPWMSAIQQKYKQEGLEVIAINLDSDQEDAKKFLSGHTGNFTVLFDPKGITPERYGVMGMPTSFIISKSGKILVQHTGFNKEDRAELEQQIQSALDGRN